MLAKKILFIGGAGFIGSNIVKLFLSNPLYRVFVFGRTASSDFNFNIDIEFIKGELSNFPLIENAIRRNGIDIVVHLASALIPSSDYSDFEKEFVNVITPSVHLVKFCADNKIKLIYFSSGGAIYGNSTEFCLSENDCLAPISYYGLSKQIVEGIILFEARNNNLNYLILRPSNPYGPGQSLNSKQGLVSVCIGKMLSNEPIIIWGDGSSVRDYIYIDDLADMVFQLIDKEISNEIINLGSGCGHSVNDVISILREISGRGSKIIYEAGRSSDVARVVLNIDKLKSFCSVKSTPMEVGIKRYYQFLMMGNMS